MKLRLSLLLLVLLGLGACGMQRVLRSAPPAPSSSLYLAALETPLNTPEPTMTALVPSLTPTLIPPPEVPTLETNRPALEKWIGLPTYGEESEPGLGFQVLYNVLVWGLTEDETGMHVLVHRRIPYCRIAPVAGRGLPRGWTAESEFRDVGPLRFEVVTVSQEGQVHYVNYFGRSGGIVTGFQVTFDEQMKNCLRDAEAVLQTLKAVPAPTPMPTPTLDGTPIPTP